MELPKAILFDADGTLYESEAIGYEASRLTALELHNFDLTLDSYMEGVVRGIKTTHELFVAHGLAADREQVNLRKRHHYKRLVVEQLQPIPGLFDFLVWCEHEAIQLLIVSVNRRSFIDACLAVLYISNFFEVIISKEDLDSREKPDPYPYQLGLRLASVSAPQALAIEDTHKGLTSAKAASLHSIGMRNDINDDTQLRLADHIASSYDEVKDYLLR